MPIHYEEHENTEFCRRTQAAIKALEKENFSAYIHCLDDLGSFLNILYSHKNPEHHAAANKAIKLHQTNWLESYVKPAYDLSDSLAYCAFEEAWIDDYLRIPVPVHGYRRYLSPKAKLNRSTRKNINVGMRAIALSINKNVKPTKDHDKAKQLDKQACNAILSYKTRKQKILEHTGTVLAIIMSIVCSITTTAAVAITLAAWPIALAGIITFVVFAATLAINWLSFRGIVPRMLHDMFGKDKLFEGWREYRDEDTGQKKQLSLPRKIILGLSTAGAALISITTGAVTYGFIIGLGKLALFSFLAAGTIGAACLPPVGIAIATIFCIASLVLIMKPILNMIKSKNIKNMFKKPFLDAAAIFDPNNKKNVGKSALRLKVEKGISFAILGVLSAFALTGLVILQVQDGAALARFLSTSTAISSTIAVGIANAISAVTVLIGQLPYTLRSLSNALIAVVTGTRSLFTSAKPNHSLPKKIKEKVVNGIKDTANAVDPNAVIKKEATQTRLARLDNLAVPDTTTPPGPTTKLPRPRYYNLYLFAKNDARPINETPAPIQENTIQP